LNVHKFCETGLKFENVAPSPVLLIYLHKDYTLSKNGPQFPQVTRYNGFHIFLARFRIHYYSNLVSRGFTFVAGRMQMEPTKKPVIATLTQVPPTNFGKSRLLWSNSGLIRLKLWWVSEFIQQSYIRLFLILAKYGVK
jgi:hypothetical protein